MMHESQKHRGAISENQVQLDTYKADSKDLGGTTGDLNSTYRTLCSYTSGILGLKHNARESEK